MASEPPSAAAFAPYAVALSNAGPRVRSPRAAVAPRSADRRTRPVDGGGLYWWLALRPSTIAALAYIPLVIVWVGIAAYVNGEQKNPAGALIMEQVLGNSGFCDAKTAKGRMARAEEGCAAA